MQQPCNTSEYDFNRKVFLNNKPQEKPIRCNKVITLWFIKMAPPQIWNSFQLCMYVCVECTCGIKMCEKCEFCGQRMRVNTLADSDLVPFFKSPQLKHH